MPDRRPSALLAFLAAVPAALAAQGVPPIQNPVSQTALKEAEQLGFDAAAQERFWTDWRKDITAASRPEWRDLIVSCAKSPDPCLRLWALARQVEAGDVAALQAYGKRMAEQLASFQVAEPDWRLTILTGPDGLPGASWQIRRDSPFWKAFPERLAQRMDRDSWAQLYAIWSWNGAPEDRDAMTDLARRLADDPFHESSSWEDPRFRMVMDWLCEFGERADWDRITGLWPKDSAAFQEASRLYEDLKGYPSFWGPVCASGKVSLLSGPRPVLRGSGRLFREALARKLGTRGRFGFEICIGHDGRLSRCRPVPAPGASAATTTGVRYLSSWAFSYPGVERARWPDASRMHTEFVLK